MVHTTTCSVQAVVEASLRQGSKGKEVICSINSGLHYNCISGRKFDRIGPLDTWEEGRSGVSFLGGIFLFSIQLNGSEGSTQAIWYRRSCSFKNLSPRPFRILKVKTRILNHDQKKISVANAVLTAAGQKVPIAHINWTSWISEQSSRFL